MAAFAIQHLALGQVAFGHRHGVAGPEARLAEVGPQHGGPVGVEAGELGLEVALRVGDLAELRADQAGARRIVEQVDLGAVELAVLLENGECFGGTLGALFAIRDDIATDVQTQVLSAVEQLSTLYLVPKFAHTTDTVVHELAGMLNIIEEVTRTLRETQATYDEAGRRLVDVVSRLGPSLGDMREDLAQVKRLLREGFRLPAAGRDE